MSEADAITRLNKALEGRYAIERESWGRAVWRPCTWLEAKTWEGEWSQRLQR